MTIGATNRISHAKLLSLLTYHPDTGRFTWNVKRGPSCAGTTAGTVADDGYTIIVIEGRKYRANVLAWFYMKKRWPKRQVDHANNRRGDDSWDNLRLATNGQNGANKPKLKTNTTGFKGVSFDGKRRKYRAQVQKDGKKKHVGYFECPTAAALAHDKAAVRMHGRFARTNGVSPSGPRHRALVPAFGGSNPSTPASSGALA